MYLNEKINGVVLELQDKWARQFRAIAQGVVIDGPYEKTNDQLRRRSQSAQGSSGDSAG